MDDPRIAELRLQDPGPEVTREQWASAQVPPGPPGIGGRACRRVNALASGRQIRQSAVAQQPRDPAAVRIPQSGTKAGAASVTTPTTSGSST